MPDSGNNDGLKPGDTGSRTMNVSRSQLPLHCPPDEQSLWNSHPRVYIPIEEGGNASCPYCGNQFHLEETAGS